ncbi:MAG TPA: hemerythrin domain-containing protein [Candidatus Eisenbacteria bacterium]|nr:hemerythrin domain-containing protein [Candidatus Eisenbacteria bacterium]
MEYNSEAITKMVERLRTEHRDFRLELIEIEETSKFTSHKAIEKLEEIGRLIVRHEVEEEARIIQVITEKVKEPERLVKVIQEHRSIIDLLEKKISQLEDSSQEVVEEIKTLCNDMRKHFSEEEEIVFPLMLKAISK